QVFALAERGQAVAVDLGWTLGPLGRRRFHRPSIRRQLLAFRSVGEASAAALARWPVGGGRDLGLLGVLHGVGLVSAAHSPADGVVRRPRRVELLSRAAT